MVKSPRRLVARFKNASRRPVKAIRRRPDEDVDRLRHLVKEGYTEALGELFRLLRRRGWKGYDLAIVEIELTLAVTIKKTSKRKDHGVSYYEMEAKRPGSNGESKWLVFESEQDARVFATGDLIERMQANPAHYAEALEPSVTVDEGVLEDLIHDEVFHLLADLDEDEIAREAGLGREWERLERQWERARGGFDREYDGYADEGTLWEFEEMREEAERQMTALSVEAEEILWSRLFDDPVSQVHDDPRGFLVIRGYSLWDPNTPGVTIHYGDAAEQEIRERGVAHHLDTYDGISIKLTNGAVAYGVR